MRDLLGLCLVASALSLHCPLCARPAYARARLVRLQEPEVDEIALTLTGCSNGIGVGLDENNKVDMIKDGTPAAKFFKKGDKVMTWNGAEMTQVVGGRIERRPLKDVVEAGLDKHTVTVKRERKPWTSNYEPTAWDGNSWEEKKW